MGIGDSAERERCSENYLEISRYSMLDQEIPCRECNAESECEKD